MIIVENSITKFNKIQKLEKIIVSLIGRTYLHSCS